MKNTRTFQNLMNAFAGESQAVQRYRMYSKIAANEGWSNIAAIFEETATNEYFHANEYYKIMCNLVGEENMPEMMEVTAAYPVAKKSTYDNLLYAAGGENEEVVMYREFAEIAKEENIMEAYSKFKLIADVELHHAKRYEKTAALLKVEQLLVAENATEWKCMKCGYIHVAVKAPRKCPICGFDHGDFEHYTPQY